MNLRTLPGSQVIFNASVDDDLPDAVKARAHLRVDDVYTVERVDVGNFYSEVFLREVPRVGFNTVLFRSI